MTLPGCPGFPPFESHRSPCSPFQRTRHCSGIVGLFLCLNVFPARLQDPTRKRLIHLRPPCLVNAHYVFTQQLNAMRQIRGGCSGTLGRECLWLWVARIEASERSHVSCISDGDSSFTRPRRGWELETKGSMPGGWRIQRLANCRCGCGGKSRRPGWPVVRI